MPAGKNEWQERYYKSVQTEARRRALSPITVALAVILYSGSRVAFWLLPSPLDYQVVIVAGIAMVVGSVLNARRKAGRVEARSRTRDHA